MGIFDSLFGGGGQDTVTINSGSTADPFIKQKAQENYGFAEDLTSMPYQPFAGTRLAPTSADTQRSYDLLRGGSGTYKPYLDNAAGMFQGAAGGVTPQMMASYLNPFIGEVTSRASDEVMRNAGIAKRQNTQKAVSTGNYGGSRHGVVESELNRDAIRAIADMTANVNMQGWNTALTAGQNDLNRMLSAGTGMTSLGTAAQRGVLQDAAAASAAGQEQEGKVQAGLDIDYADYMRQYAFPFDMLQFRQSLLTGQPANTNTWTQQPVQSPSVAGQVGGLALTLPLLIQMLG